MHDKIEGDTSLFFGDLNGDGVSDVAVLGNRPVKYYYSTGSAVTLGLTYSPDSDVDDDVLLSGGDFNGDGQIDIVHHWRNDNNRKRFDVLVRSGTGVQSTCGPEDNIPLGLADRNGDSKSELMHEDEYRCYEVDAVVPDLLKRHTVSAGGTVDVEYLPSTYWSNGYLPFVVQAVSKVKTSDGR